MWLQPCYNLVLPYMVRICTYKKYPNYKLQSHLKYGITNKCKSYWILPLQLMWLPNKWWTRLYSLMQDKRHNFSAQNVFDILYKLRSDITKMGRSQNIVRLWPEKNIKTWTTLCWINLDQYVNFNFGFSANK